MSSDYSDSGFGDSGWDVDPGLDGSIADRLAEIREQQEDPERIARELGIQVGNWDGIPSHDNLKTGLHARRAPRNLERERQVGLPDPRLGPNARSISPGADRERANPGPDAATGLPSKSVSGRPGVGNGDGPGGDDSQRPNPPAYPRKLRLERVASQQIADTFGAKKPAEFSQAKFQALLRDVRFTASGELHVALTIPMETESAVDLRKAYGLMLDVTVNRISFKKPADA